jgi:hypothetical protein
MISIATSSHGEPMLWFVMLFYGALSLAIAGYCIHSALSRGRRLRSQLCTLHCAR